MNKVAIVGPEELKWKTTSGPWTLGLPKINKAKKEIEYILTSYEASQHGVPMKKLIKDNKVDRTSFWSYADVILVSGHCPNGGVDIWAEEKADEFGIKKEIYPAEVNQWPDEVTEIPFNKNEARVHGMDTKGLRFDGYYYYRPFARKGYKSRNIQIAEACDVLYCVVPFIKGLSCKHHHANRSEGFNHPDNGGCWTRQYAKELGKETHLVVIS